jgi:anti-sigma B factor antagonist
MTGYYHLDVSQRDDATIVRFKGRRRLVVARVVYGVGRELGELASGQDRRTLILDFAGVADLSNVMLGVLVMLRKKTAAERRPLVLCGLGPKVRRFLNASLLSQLFEIRETAAEAASTLAHAS